MRVMLSGGGTGGHIYPGLALARYIISRDRDARVLFVGTDRGLETKLVPAAGFPLKTIPVRSFGKTPGTVLSAVSRLLKSIKETGIIIKEFSPEIVVGTGGYVSGPVVLAAKKAGVPVVLHEQNAIPGRANRVMSLYARKVCVSFPPRDNGGPHPDKQYFREDKIVFTGNPRASEMIMNLNLNLNGEAGKRRVRREEAMKKAGLPNPRLKTLLVFGGSQGALRINEVTGEVARRSNALPQTQILYVTGERYYDQVKNELKGSSLPGVVIKPYISDMPEILPAIDLVISRAGATAIAEITAMGIPAILIPSPNVAHNHQYYNALYLSRAGAAVLIEEKELTGDRLLKEIQRLLTTHGLLEEMGEKSRRLGLPEAAENIYRCLLAEISA